MTRTQSTQSSICGEYMSFWTDRWYYWYPFTYPMPWVALACLGIWLMFGYIYDSDIVKRTLCVIVPLVLVTWVLLLCYLFIGMIGVPIALTLDFIAISVELWKSNDPLVCFSFAMVTAIMIASTVYFTRSCVEFRKGFETWYEEM
jgi:hypothetical protein